MPTRPALVADRAGMSRPVADDPHRTIPGEPTHVGGDAGPNPFQLLPATPAAAPRRRRGGRPRFAGPAVVGAVSRDGEPYEDRRHRLVSAAEHAGDTADPAATRPQELQAGPARRCRRKYVLPHPPGKATHTMGQIILVRHAETAWNRTRRYYTGQDDPELTPAGEHEAALLRPHLAAYRDAHVLCSPALRARRTAEIAGLQADFSADLREWSYRLPHGHTVDDGCEAAQCRHDVWNSALRSRTCAGECLADVTARADHVLDCAHRLLTGGRDVVLVTHGNLIRILTARWLGLPGGAGAHLALRTASIGRLAVYDARPSLLGWNFTPASDVLSVPPQQSLPGLPGSTPSAATDVRAAAP